MYSLLYGCVDVWIMYRQLADTVSGWIDELLGLCTNQMYELLNLSLGGCVDCWMAVHTCTCMCMDHWMDRCALCIQCG